MARHPNLDVTLSGPADVEFMAVRVVSMPSPSFIAGCSTRRVDLGHQNVQFGDPFLRAVIAEIPSRLPYVDLVGDVWVLALIRNPSPIVLTGQVREYEEY